MDNKKYIEPLKDLIKKVKDAAGICKEIGSTCIGCPYHGEQYCRCVLTGDALKVITYLEGSNGVVVPIKKFLFVEDGSVDTDELQEVLEERAPDIRMVVYRQGSVHPELVDVEAVLLEETK